MIALMVAVLTAMPMVPPRQEESPVGMPPPSTAGTVAPIVGTRWTLRNYDPVKGVTNRIIEETVVAVAGREITTERVDTIFPKKTKSAPETIRFSLDDRQYSATLQPGERWEEPAQESGGSTIVTTVLGPEQISTPAGSFAAIKIATSFAVKGKKYDQLIWYAPAVAHFVKLEFLGSGKAIQTTELTDITKP